MDFFNESVSRFGVPFALGIFLLLRIERTLKANRKTLAAMCAKLREIQACGESVKKL